MTTWSVVKKTSGAEDAQVTDNSKGEITFPKNESDNDWVYTISVTTDDGCTTSTTYTIKSGDECKPIPPPPTSCTVVLSLASSEGKYLPCDDDEHDKTLFDFEVYTKEDGVESKTDEGTAEAIYKIKSSNCNGFRKTIYFDDIEFFELKYNNIDILEEYANCKWEGEFEQEGKQGIDIESCDDIKWSVNGVTINEEIKWYNHITGSNTVTVKPVLPDGSNVECANSSVIFYAEGFAPNGDEHDIDSWSVQCNCCQERQKCTGGTSGNTVSTGAYLTEVEVQESALRTYGLVETGNKAKLELGEKYNSYITLNYSTTSSNGRLVDDCCNSVSVEDIYKTPVFVGARVEFEIYQNQTTKTGSTIKCSMDIYYNLANINK